MAGSQAARFLSAGTLAQRTGSYARCLLAEASLPAYWRIASKPAIHWQTLHKTMAHSIARRSLVPTLTETGLPKKEAQNAFKLAFRIKSNLGIPPTLHAAMLAMMKP